MTLELYPGYLNLGGNEILNTSRLEGILESQGCVAPVTRGPSCETLQDALSLLGLSEGAISVADAPWYDLDLPDVSGGFYGVAAVDVQQMYDSTREVDVSEHVLNGATIGRMRLGSREVKVTAVLLAKDSASLEYGRTWLESASLPGACGQHGDRCGVTDLAFFTDCPGGRDEFLKPVTTITEPRRNLALNPTGGGDATSGTIPEWSSTTNLDLVQDAGFDGTAETSVLATRNATGAARATVAMGEYAAAADYAITVAFNLSVEMSVAASLRPDGASAAGEATSAAVTVPVGITTQTFLIHTTTTAPGATSALSFVTSSGAVADTLGITNVLLEKIESPTDEDFIETRRNRALNPDMISGGSGAEVKTRFGWSNAWTTGITDHPAGLTTARRTTQPSVTASESSSRGIDWYGNTQQGGASAGGDWLKQPVETGVPVTVSVWVRYSRALEVRSYLSIRLLNYDGTSASWVGSALNISDANHLGNGGTDWLRLWGTFTPTNPAATHVVILNGIAGGETLEQGFWMEQSGVLIEHGVQTPSEYFSGNTPSADPLVRYRWTDATNGSPSVEEMAPAPEIGGFFDGDTDAHGEYTYSWAEDPYSSVSVETRTVVTWVEDPEAYAENVNSLVRYLHGVAVTSGPSTVEEYRFKTTDLVGQQVEFFVTSERPWVYGRTRDVSFPTTGVSVLQDTPFNFVPYPSAELPGANVTIARNLSANPSVETVVTGWTATAATGTGTAPTAYFTSGRVTGELAAVGTSSMRARILGNSSTEVAASTSTVTIYQDVSLALMPVGGAVSLNMWAAAVIVTGTAVSAVNSVKVEVEWRTASAAVSTTVIGTAANATEMGGKAYSLAAQTPPATATIARVRAVFGVTWRSSATAANNSDIRMYTDALAVTVP